MGYFKCRIWQRMFSGAIAFNNNGSALVTWDASSVETMIEMFNGAAAFDKPLDTWNVSSVKIWLECF